MYYLVFPEIYIQKDEVKATKEKVLDLIEY